MRSTLALIALVAFALAACDSEAVQDDFPEQVVFGGDRPAPLQIPLSYEHTEPVPLLVVLHGYGASGLLQLSYTGLRNLTESGYLVIGPEGTVDSNGNQFWNAGDWCCNFDDSDVDDVAYLTGLIEEIRGVYKVDPDRIYVFGHSNGGFMSYRLACEYADSIATIVSLAGAGRVEPSDCAPSAPVSILQIHGDADDTILYDGDALYPSAADSLAPWANYNDCSGGLSADSERLDLDSSLDGEETRIERYSGCSSDVDVELWTLESGGHVPILQSGFAQQIESWLAAHPKS